jgi:ankyrin repeat protein
LTKRGLRRAGAAIACLLLASCSTFMQQPGTPLAQAAHHGNIAEMRRLVSAGANPNAYDATSQTPLHWAARGGHPLGPHECRSEADERTQVVAALLDLGADVNLVDRRAAIPGGTSGRTALHVALEHEQFKIAELLLQRGANPLIRSAQGQTVLALASEQGAPKALLATIVARQ